MTSTPAAAELPRDLIPLANGASRVGVSQKTFRRHIAAGRIPAYRVGRLIKVSADDLHLLLRPIPAGGDQR